MTDRLDTRVPEASDAREFFRSAVDHYDALHYGAAEHSLMTARLARVCSEIDRLALPAGARALDAGCGPGYLVEALVARGFETWAIDTSPGMLRKARERAGGGGPPKARLQLGSIEMLPFAAESFDLVCSTGVIEYLAEDRGMLREASRVLRPGGRFVLCVTNRWSPALVGDFAVEFLKRRRWLREPFNAAWTRLGRPPLRARPFRVRRHRPARVRRLLDELGLRVESDAYFHFAPWPHPLQRVFPRVTQRLAARLEGLSSGPLGALADGYLVRCRKGPS